MKASAERIEGCQVVLNVEAEPEEMEKSLESAYRRLVNRVEVPGFRKGKAPRPLLERHIGRDALVGEALDKLVPDLYEKALEEQEVDAIGQPEMEMVQLDPAIFKATVPVQPVVELGDYTSISATPEEVNVTEEDVNEAIDNLRRNQASWEPVEREARFGDSVTIDVQGTIDGETVLDNKQQAYTLTEGSTSPLPGFVDQIVEMQIGEEKEFPLMVPEDFANENFQGKECFFKVSVSEIKEEKLPELNDEFAKSLEQNVETVEQLREMVAERIKNDREQEAKQKLEEQAIEQAVNVSKVEFPSVLVDQEIESTIQNQLARLGGMQLEDFLRIKGSTEEELREELRPNAEKRVANSLLLNKVSEQENIEVSDEDIDAELERRLQEVGDNQNIRQYMNSEESRERIRNELRMRKTIERLVKLATTEGSAESAQSEEQEMQEKSEEEAETQE
ncbi:MAG: trigger factor [Dehalococcoidia bacterium]